MAAAELIPHEQVHVWDVDNAARFVTYVIAGPAGSGTIQVNGAAAHLVESGHKVIVASFASFAAEEVWAHEPVVVHVDAGNTIVRVDSDPGTLLGSPLASQAGDLR
jgi:aspartate 1-decarboxylase